MIGQTVYLSSQKGRGGACPGDEYMDLRNDPALFRYPIIINQAVELNGQPYCLLFV